MDFIFLSQINYLAVGVAAIIFWCVGSAWFSPLLMSALWVAELKRHNVLLQRPSSNTLLTKMLLTFGANLLASLAMAWLVVMTNSSTVSSGLMLGIITVLGFAVTTLGQVFIWENRSVKLFLIDIGYPALGIIITAVLLSVWR
jgi:hypothetical protein